MAMPERMITMLRARQLITLTPFVLALLAPVPAFAEEAVQRAPAKSDSYGYVFVDDPLAAGGLGSSVAPIVLRRRTFGATLIRPRTNFVPELLKTVEGL